MKINIRVQPNSGRQEIVELSKNKYKIFLKKQALDDKANKELEKLIKKEWKMSAKIVKGFTSRDKVIEVE